METVLLSGNEAVARGAYECGVAVAAAYPGTPSSEILASLAHYEGVFCEWSTNEKVAYEVAFGAAVSGVRALTAFKSAGANVAADPMVSSVYTGVNGGLVVVCAGDPGMASSSTEQDDRYYGRLAGIPLLEPSSSQECKDYVGLAFELSEAHDLPVMLRLTTRISHSTSLVQLAERVVPEARSFERNPAKYCLLPGFARELRRGLTERLAAFCTAASAQLVSYEPGAGECARIGVVAGGAAYLAAKEAVPEACFLKLGLVHPLPIEAIREFAAGVDRLFVVEELDPFVEEQLRAAGIPCEGKKYFPSQLELTPEIVGRGFVAAGLELPRWREVREASDPTVIPRAPVMCAGCPHRGMTAAIKKLNLDVNGDIGCYDLICLPPLSQMHTVIDMGASIGMAQGYTRAYAAHGRNDAQSIAVIGDSTFLHSGITGLLNAVHQGTNITVLIQDNSITAMTGGQTNPGCQRTLAGASAEPVDLEGLCRALGVRSVQVVDPYEYEECLVALRSALAFRGPAVVITNRPCVLFPSKLRAAPFVVDEAACTACQRCLRLACPALSWSDAMVKHRHKATIDAAVCTGCSLCAQLCPAGAIIEVGAS